MTDFVHPFFKATQEVFRLMLDLEIEKSAVPSEEEGLRSKAVYVSIGIVGDLEGSINYCFPESMTLEMVRILSGMEMAELDDFVASALSEMVNIISGNAVTDLFVSQYTCDILPPAVEVSDRRADWGESGKLLRLETAIGPMEVDIRLSRTKSA